jgi:hypothetical protein
MTGIERLGTGDLFTEDFVLQCGSKHVGQRCNSGATHWVAYHHVGACKHPSLDVDGNHCAWVCWSHFGELHAKARRMVRYYNPPWFLKWWTDRKPFCPSCGIPVQTVGDVLQEEISLWQ